ncbi:hypothetical protein BDF21DRAFT_477123 [Thamnidium elegans]|nr:hypothetical protein BDF21DRAFT_477123 [Thamnidium elegans]
MKQIYLIIRKPGISKFISSNITVGPYSFSVQRYTDTGYINGNVVLAMAGYDITVANFFLIRSLSRTLGLLVLDTISIAPRNLHDQLYETKAKYKVSGKATRSEYSEYNYVPEVLSEINRANAITRITNSLKAEGTPNSAKRSKNTPFNLSSMDISGHKSRSGEPSIFFKAIINRYRPSDANYKEVMKSEELIKACYSSWPQYLLGRGKPGSANYSTKVQRVREMRSQQAQRERRGYSYTNQVHNANIKMTTRGHATLYWVDSQNRQVDLEITIPYVPAETVPRTPRITEGGINLIPQSEGLKTISVDKFSLKACKDERVYTV